MVKRLTVIVKENVDIGFIGLSRFRETERWRADVPDEDYETIKAILVKVKAKQI